MRKKVRVCVIGIDGGTWNVIKPWLKDLPNLSKLMNNSVWAEMESTYPFFTSPAWKCYSSGKNPGKLGAYAWFNLDLEKKEIKLNISSSFKGKEIWDWLSESGYKCVIINMPQTYPPKKVKGIMISGFPAFDWSDYTYPKDYKKKLIRKYDYKINPKHNLSLNKEKALQEIECLIRSRFRIAKDLLKDERPDFLNVTIFYIDKLQHFLWKHKSIIKEFWKIIDKEIGELLQVIDKTTYVFIISDHGFTELRAVFRLNMWLQQKGYLHLKSNPFRKKLDVFMNLYKLGLNRERILKIITFLNLTNLIRKILPEDKIISIQHHIPSGKEELEIASVVKYVNWNKTKAIVAAENCLYINLPKKSEEYSKFRDKLTSELQNIKDPRTNEKIIVALKKKEDVYTGEFIDFAPDLAIVPQEGYRVYDGITKERIWDFSDDPWSGYHKVEGIFLVHGPDIKRTGEQIKNVKIYDLNPTILHIFGIPIPENTDGRVLTEVFKPNSELANRKIVYGKTQSEKKREQEEKSLTEQDTERIKERLKSLGYF